MGAEPVEFFLISQCEGNTTSELLERKERVMDSTFLMFASVMLAIFIGGLVVYKKS